MNASILSILCLYDHYDHDDDSEPSIVKPEVVVIGLCCVSWWTCESIRYVVFGTSLPI